MSLVIDEIVDVNVWKRAGRDSEIIIDEVILVGESAGCKGEGKN